MKSMIASLVLIGGFVATACAAADMPSATTALTDQQRIDSLTHQNQMLVEEIKALQAEYERPRTIEETFAACMQAARGTTSAMAAESIGGHCDKLLKK